MNLLKNISVVVEGNDGSIMLPNVPVVSPRCRLSEGHPGPRIIDYRRPTPMDNGDCQPSPGRAKGYGPSGSPFDRFYYPNQLFKLFGDFSNCLISPRKANLLVVQAPNLHVLVQDQRIYELLRRQPKC